MNERIQKLAEQAGISYLSSVPPDMWEKFAELIVRECMTVARKADGLDAEYEAWYLIKQHFGVEE